MGVKLNHVYALKEKHTKLEEEITNISNLPQPDPIKLHQLKKEKLRIKDELYLISNNPKPTT